MGCTNTDLTDAELLERFAELNIWRRGDERAPHKPLLLLYTLAALQRGEDLRSQPDLVNRIAQQLLDAHWEPSYHDDILNAIGMPWVTIRQARKRDPAFRDTILRIYEHRCAVCGYDGQLDRTDLGIEAAHIKWHAAGGPDTPDNGLALCAFHHKAFDRGAIGLSDDRRILISQHVRGSHGVDEWLVRFTGQPARTPLQGEPTPAAGNVNWHRTEVFRAPPRSR